MNGVYLGHDPYRRKNGHKIPKSFLADYNKHLQAETQIEIIFSP